MNKTESMLGYSITTLSKEECISIILNWIENKERRYFVCANPHSLEIARKDREFCASLKNADIVIPDGVGIVIASKLLSGNICNRITGWDVFMGLSSTLNKKQRYSYFFLGSTKETLTKIEERMKIDFPHIKVVGAYSPPFKKKFSEEDNGLIVEMINKVKPDVLWVGMTAPKQEKWIYKNIGLLDVSFVGAIGAVFDFYSGNVKYPIPTIKKMGIEWLIRFIREPRRMWKRNLVSAPKFLLRIIGYKARNIFRKKP